MIDETSSHRRRIVDAVLELVARGGVRGATVRAVAAETGLSMGSVRHVFASQDELRRCAMTEVVAAVRARLAEGAPDRAAAARGGPRAVVEAAVEVCAAFLPLDEERTREARIYAAFLAEAEGDPGIAAIGRDAVDALRAGVRGVVDALASAGALGVGRDPEQETVRLWALLDGLAAHLLFHPALVTPAAARAVVEAHLTELTGPRR